LEVQSDTAIAASVGGIASASAAALVVDAREHCGCSVGVFEEVFGSVSWPSRLMVGSARVLVGFGEPVQRGRNIQIYKVASSDA